MQLGLGVSEAEKGTAAKGFSKYVDYLMVAPGAIWIIIFLFIPIAIVIITSFYTLVGYTPQPIFTLKNYMLIFSSKTYIEIILYSLKLAFQVTAICFALGFPAAYYMATRIKSDATKTILLLVMLIPFWIDWTVRTIAWYPILGQLGLINYVLLSIGMIKQPSTLFMQSELGATLAMIEAYVLFMIAPIFLSMNKIDRGYIQAAESLGANRFRAFYEVVWKMSLPGVAIGWLFVFVMAISDFATPSILGGTIQTIGKSVAYSIGILNWPLAGAFATILIIITFVIIYIILKLVDVKSMVF